jgi:hypothetical protein
MGGAYSVTAGDWNADGRMDLAAGRWFSEGGLEVYVAAESESFHKSADLFEGLRVFLSLQAGDLDGDGRTDIIAGDSPLSLPGQFLLSLFSGDGQGGFRHRPLRSLEQNPQTVLLGELDGDGAIDAVVLGSHLTNQSGDSSSVVHLVRGAGGPEPLATRTFLARSLIQSAALGDMDADGAMDLAVTSWTERTVEAFWNDGKARLAGLVRGAATTGARALATGDLDSDGDPDFAAVEPAAGAVHVFLRRARAFTAERITERVPPSPKALAIGDIDGDRALDIAIAGDFAAGVLWQDGSGEFPSAWSAAAGSTPGQIQLADLDGDGDLDLATGNQVPGSATVGNVSVYFNQGARKLAPARNYASQSDVASFEVADMDQDGDVDLIAGSSATTPPASLLRNQGSGTFAPAEALALEQSVILLQARDWDLDGRTDLLISSGYSIGLMLNLGNGSAFERVNTLLGSIESFDSADLDGDGQLDLVAYYPSELRTARGRGRGGAEYSTGVPLDGGGGHGASGSSPVPGLSSIAHADFDSDGAVDLVVSSLPLMTITVAINRSPPSRVDADGNGVADECETGGARFRRGDTNEDTRTDISDAVWILRFLFLGGEGIRCRKSGDANDDQVVDVSDAVTILGYLFAGAPRLPGPFPGCGVDPTVDDLPCTGQTGC